MKKRPYKYFGTMAEHFQQMEEMFEGERQYIATLTKEEKKQYLIDAGVYHLLVGPKRRTSWRKKSTRRKQKDVAQLKRLRRR